MKISNLFREFDWFVGFLTLSLVVFFGGLAWAVISSIHTQQHFQEQFPIGSAIQLKGLNVKGNVVKFNGKDVTILVIDSSGQSHQLTTDANILTK